MPALKPYWGKPAVRNFRGGDGNGGIIRSPQRAIVLPDCGGRGVTCVPTAIIAYHPIPATVHLHDLLGVASPRSVLPLVLVFELST